MSIQPEVETVSTSKRPELYMQNMTAPLPQPFVPAPWWQCLFNRWTEPEFVQIVGYKHRHDFADRTTEWQSFQGSLYRQTDRRTGARRYFIRCQHGDVTVDGGAWESGQTLIFT